MSDNNGGGVLGGLLIGLGFAGIVLAPFYIASRYGVHVLAGIAAVFATGYAVLSPELVAMANEIGDCGHLCLAAPGAKLILELDKFGWWWLAGVMWLAFALSVLAQAVRQPHPEQSQ